MDYLLDLAAENPEHIPEPLLDQPTLPEASAATLQAFLDLSQCRSMGYSAPNPITASDILAYIQINPICEPRRFFALVRSLDSVFLAWAEKQAAQSKNGHR